ncbi:cell division protein SepF [Rothia sp. CCM 9419]|uniref:cell division protein SepF n=1 Tax=Rothia sp. CCM 9419 TaxID=3402662 RepID=UPI003AE8A5F5
MAGRTFHQAMSFLGLGEQAEPARDRVQDRYDDFDDYAEEYDDDYRQNRDVLYNFPDDEYDQYPVEEDASRVMSHDLVSDQREDPYLADEEKAEQKYEPTYNMTPSEQKTEKSFVSSNAVGRTPQRTQPNDESEEELRLITTVHPRSYNDAKTIGETYRSNIPVIMNVTEMTESDAKRLIDFCAGLTFALEGSLERVTEKVFLLTPSNVEVAGSKATEVPVAIDSESLDFFTQG